MIQFKRGTTSVELKEISILGFKFYIPKRIPGSWKSIKLADGQPGYDKAVRKLKVGDGEHTWEELPYLSSGLEAEQILDSELRARARKIINNDETIFTYGTIDPDNDMVGQVYFQQFDGKPEADYVVECGRSGIWYYRKWYSGLSECWGTLLLTTHIATPWGRENQGTYYNGTKKMDRQSYPENLFIDTPVEIVSATMSFEGSSEGSSKGSSEGSSESSDESNPDEIATSVGVWTATAENNTKTQTARYHILKGGGPVDKQEAQLSLNFAVTGYWKN